jgi:hypothetical protein
MMPVKSSYDIDHLYFTPFLRATMVEARIAKATRLILLAGIKIAATTGDNLA